MSAKSTRYLQYLPSGYTFRFRLPKDVRSKFKSAEIKFSLRTHSFAKSRNYSRLYALFMELRFSWQFWLIVMAPLTGCRLEEMCQLHLSDILQEDGVWLLDINSNARDKTLKNESSPRLIPLMRNRHA